MIANFLDDGETCCKCTRSFAINEENNAVARTYGSDGTILSVETDGKNTVWPLLRHFSRVSVSRQATDWRSTGSRQSSIVFRRFQGTRTLLDRRIRLLVNHVLTFTPFPNNRHDGDVRRRRKSLLACLKAKHDRVLSAASIIVERDASSTFSSLC